MFNQLWCARAIELLVDRPFISFISMSQTHIPLMRMTRDLERLSDVSHEPFWLEPVSSLHRS